MSVSSLNEVTGQLGNIEAFVASALNRKAFLNEGTNVPSAEVLVKNIEEGGRVKHFANVVIAMDSIRGALLKDEVVEVLGAEELRRFSDVFEEMINGEQVFVVRNLKTLNDVHAACQRKAISCQDLWKFKEYCLRGFDVMAVYKHVAQMINEAYDAWGKTPIDVIVGRGSGSGRLTCDLLKSLLPLSEQSQLKFHFGYNWSDIAKMEYISKAEGGKVFFVSMGLVLDFGQGSDPLRLKAGDLCFPQKIISRIDMVKVKDLRPDNALETEEAHIRLQDIDFPNDAPILFPILLEKGVARCVNVSHLGGIVNFGRTTTHI
jgi:hypothetical protein